MAGAEEVVEEEEAEGDGPEAKRQRVGSLGVLQKKKTSWADLADEEEDELAIAEEKKKGVTSSEPRRCDHCDGVFASGNELHQHLREVECGSERAQSETLRSGAIWPAATDDGSPGHYILEDAKRHPQTETRRKEKKKEKKGSSYDICEMFSPPRIARWAKKQGLVGGWSLDLSTPCPITGRVWDCRQAADRDWARRMVYRD